MFFLLYKGENGITDLKANALKSIPDIESINLEQNAIKSINPHAFSGAKQLMLLNLFGNHITNLPPRGFKVNSQERNYIYTKHIETVLKIIVSFFSLGPSEPSLPHAGTEPDWHPQT